MYNYYDIDNKYLLYAKIRFSYIENMAQHKGLGYQRIVSNIYVCICIFSHK